MKKIMLSGKATKMISLMVIMIIFALIPISAETIDDYLLFEAIFSNDQTRILELLDSGADVDASDDYGRTPLLAAVVLNDLDLVSTFSDLLSTLPHIAESMRKELLLTQDA